VNPDLKAGEIVACGTPDDIRNDPRSITGRFI
jgi:excinuclease UvrABC ATPase subunit